jgi:hypothetical protein
LLLALAQSAWAATYSLTCELARGGAFTIELSSFSFHVGGAAASLTGSGAGKRTNTFELIFRFPVSSVYQTLLGVVESGEDLKNCRLTEAVSSLGTASSGTAAKDNWNAMAVPKGKGNKNQGNSQPAGGTLEWTFNNASLTGLTALGTDGSGTPGTPAGSPEAVVQGTIVAQSFSFSLK